METNETTNKRPECPKTWLAESILATIFCCLPLGIVGIVNAARVNSLYIAECYEEAVKASENAKKWTLISVGIGIAGYVIYFILLAAGIASI